MLQSLFADSFDLERLLSALSSVGGVGRPSSSSSEAATASELDSGCCGDAETELTAAESDASSSSWCCCACGCAQKPSVRLIARPNALCCLPSDLVIVTEKCDQPAASCISVSTGHVLLEYMEEFVCNKEKLQTEWEMLNLNGCCDAETTAAAATVAAANISKNRCRSSLPCDRTLVRLRPDTEADSSCSSSSSSIYINASVVFDSDPRQRYIVTQGPISNTVADFWLMVWQTSAVTVVNLAAGSGDCEQYWPTASCRSFGGFEVHLVSEHVCCEEFVVRNFRLKRKASRRARTVTMFHFAAWEEGCVPDVCSLLRFRRKVNKAYRGSNLPTVIHCSDGLGRSGAYCLLDVVLKRIDRGVKEVDVAATLEHLREQRPGLVTEFQLYEFTVTAVAEEITEMLQSMTE